MKMNEKVYTIRVIKKTSNYIDYEYLINPKKVFHFNIPPCQDLNLINNMDENGAYIIKSRTQEDGVFHFVGVSDITAQYKSVINNE